MAKLPGRDDEALDPNEMRDESFADHDRGLRHAGGHGAPAGERATAVLTSKILLWRNPAALALPMIVAEPVAAGGGGSGASAKLMKMKQVGERDSRSEPWLVLDAHAGAA